MKSVTKEILLRILLTVFKSITIGFYIFGQGQEDIARKSMAIYTHVRSLQEVFTRLEKCRKPVNMDDYNVIRMRLV